MKTLRNILLGITLSLSLNLSNCWLYPERYKLEWDGNYPGIVVFSYKENKSTQEFINKKFDELTRTQIIDYQCGCPTVYNQSIEEWFDKEANKYNKNIDIPLTLYNEQVKIPKEFTSNGEFGTDIIKFTSYLRNNYKELNNYDFISIVINEPNGNYGGYTEPYYNCFSFIVNNLDGNYGIINNTFAHEFAHLLGATDKYGSEFDGIIDDRDLMRNYNQTNLDDNVIITNDTAREIGW